MTTTTTTLDAALKEYYLPPAREQLNNKTMMLAQIERTSMHVEGRRAVLSLHVGRNSGVGARPEGGTLPSAGRQTYVEERVGMAHNYLRCAVSGQAMKSTASDAGSFVRALSSEMTDGVKDLRRDVNRQVFNNTNHTIAQTDTTTTSNEVELATTTGLAAIRQLEVGMLIDIGTVADPDSIATAREITAVDRNPATASITISGAVVSTNNSTHFITRTGNGGNELIGLREIVADTGTLHNINPSTYEVWKSIVSSNSGTARAATDNLFEEVIDTVDDTADVSPDFCVTSKGVRRNYAAQLKSMKRFNDGAALTLKGGFKALTIDCGDVSLPIIGERDCPNGTAFLLKLSDIVQHEMSDWEWADHDGNVLRWVSGKDEWECFMFKYHQLCTPRRNSHAIITDLQEGS